MTSIKKAYLYLVSLITLVIMVIGAIMLLNLALKTWVFPKADQYPKYPMTKMDCTLRPSPDKPSPDGSASTSLPPECDPNYAQEMEEYEKQNRAAGKHRTAATAIAMFVVSAPLFYLHWRLARKEQ